MLTTPPSAHTNGMMPLFDIQTNIKDGKVNYIFYYKSMANPLWLDSAMPLKIKRTALIREALRRLLRTRRVLKAEILSEFFCKDDVIGILGKEPFIIW